MRNNNQNRRSRGNRRRGGGGSTNNPNRQYESNGPEGRVRGNAQTIADKYVSLSRDAAAAGNRILAENFLQHAEHYYRILASTGIKFTRLDMKQDEYDNNNDESYNEDDDENDDIQITGSEDQPNINDDDITSEKEERAPRNKRLHDSQSSHETTDTSVREQRPDRKKRPPVAMESAPQPVHTANTEQPRLPSTISADAEQLPSFLTTQTPLKKPRVAKSVRTVKTEE